jgi:hypothetical protein
MFDAEVAAASGNSPGLESAVKQAGSATSKTAARCACIASKCRCVKKCNCQSSQADGDIPGDVASNNHESNQNAVNWVWSRRRLLGKATAEPEEKKAEVGGMTPDGKVNPLQCYCDLKNGKMNFEMSSLVNCKCEEIFCDCKKHCMCVEEDDAAPQTPVKVQPVKDGLS